MRAALGAAIAVTVLGASLQAHRLDEYLQAARLSLTPHQVLLELDLTPGVAVAPGIIALVDRDNDRTISPVEARAYGEAALSELTVAIDGRPVRVSLDSVEVPSSGELRHGVGTIQLRASGPVARLAGAGHQMTFRNDHHPENSVYLVNALRSGDPAIRVVSQHRDSLQREARIEYAIASPSPIRWFWLFAAAAVCFHRPITARLRRHAASL